MKQIGRAVAIGAFIGALIGMLFVAVIMERQGASMPNLEIFPIILLLFSAIGAVLGAIIGAIVALVKYKLAS